VWTGNSGREYINGHNQEIFLRVQLTRERFTFRFFARPFSAAPRRHLCSFSAHKIKAPSGAAYSDVARDGADLILVKFHKDAAPTVLEVLVFSI